MCAHSPAIRCRDLAVGYRDPPVLDGLSFAVDEGETMVIVGRSGSGKTTILKTLAGIREPLGGKATVLGRRLPRSPPAGELGYIPQNLGLIEHETVLANVLHGTLPELGWVNTLVGRFPPEAVQDARDAIARVGLAEKTQRRVSELSGGQRRRVAIARAFVQGPRLLLADEMLSELDEDTARSIVECLTSLQRHTGMTAVVVEHRRDVAADIADSMLTVESPHA